MVRPDYCGNCGARILKEHCPSRVCGWVTCSFCTAVSRFFRGVTLWTMPARPGPA